MIMLIQQAEKKENSSPKRYEMRYEISFGDAILMTDWNTVFSATMHFIVLKLWTTHKQMMNWILSRIFFTKEPAYNLSIEIYASLPMSVCVSFSGVNYPL